MPIIHHLQNIENETIEVEKSRGFWLSAFLVLMFIANPLTSFTYFSNPDLVVNAFPKATNEIIYFMGFMGVVNLLLAIAIWRWIKWGIYGFYISIAIAFSINLYLEIGIVSSLIGLVGGVLIFFTTKKRWQHFA